MIRGVPGLEVGQRPEAVDARVRPEIDQHDLPAQLRERQRLRVDPGAVGVDGRCNAVVRQASLGRLADSGERLAATAHLGEFALCGGVVLEPVLQERGVPRGECREVVVEMKDEPEGDRGRSVRRRPCAPSARARGGVRQLLVRRARSGASAAPHRRRRRVSAGSRGTRPSCWLRPTVTVASTGPAHGTNTSPSVAPSRNPPPTPFGRKREKAANGRSIRSPKRGMSSVAATTKSRAIARLRRKSSGSPSWPRSQAANRVKTTKLATSPATMRSGLRPDAPAGEQDRQHRQHARRHGGDHPREKADGEQDEHLLPNQCAGDSLQRPARFSAVSHAAVSSGQSPRHG